MDDQPEIQIIDLDDSDEEIETEDTDDGVYEVTDTIDLFFAQKDNDLLGEEELVFDPDPEEQVGTVAPPQDVPVKKEGVWEINVLDALQLVVPTPESQKRIEQLVKLNKLTTVRKKNIVTELQRGIVDSKGKDVTKTIGTSYKRLIEPATGKPMERSAFYFDKFYKAQDMYRPPMVEDGHGGKRREKDDKGNDLLSGMEATDLLLKRGREILAAGGSFQDVDKLLEKTGIPRDWWPEELLEEMQPWRKTTSMLQKQKLQDQYEEKKKVDDKAISPQDFLSVLQIVGEDAPTEMNEIAKLFKDSEFAKSLSTQLGVITEIGGIGDFSGVLQLLQTDDDDGIEKTKSGKREEALDKGIEGLEVLGGALNSILELVSDSESLSEEAMSFFTNTLLPGVALANCGIDLIQAGKAIVKHKLQKGQAKELEEISKGSRGSSGSHDKGKELAFSNEKGAMTKAMAQDGVKLFTTLLQGAGELSGLLGGAPGTGAKAGLSVGATVITLGSKAVFTGINWNEARKAREMLEQARAGNPVARVQIFKQSNLYAKSYLVMLAKEGDKLAVQYIVNKGIDEKALTNKSVSTRILTDALLKLSGQTSEEDVPESLAEAMAGRLGKVFQGLKEKVKATGFKPYDPNWMPPEALILASQWPGVKRDAVAHGLLDVASGIGSALEEAEKRIAPAGKAIAFRGDKTFDPLSPQGKEHRQLLLDARDALGKLESKVVDFYPMTVPLGPDGKTPDVNGTPVAHRGMTLYLDALLDKIRAAANAMMDDLVKSGLMKTDWSPAAGDRLDPNTFSKNWQSASIYACLPEDDFGAGEKLKALAVCWKEFDEARSGGDRDAAREAAVGVIDAFSELAPAIENCRVEAGAIPAMQTYLVATLEEAVKQRRQAEDAINPNLFKLLANRPLTAEEWNADFERAVTQGFASSKAPYGKVTAAITDLDKALAAATPDKDPAKQLVLIKKHALAIATLQDRLEAVEAALPPLVKLVREDILAPAREQQMKWAEARSKKEFKPKVGLSGGDWETTYKAAVEVGAVPEAKKPMTALKDALEDLTKASDAFDKAWKAKPKPWKDVRKKAKLAHAATEAAIAAANRMLHWPEFDHPDMLAHLQNALITPLETLIAKDSAIQQGLDGNTSAQQPNDFDPNSPEDFGKAVADAVNNGLVDNPNTKEFKVSHYLAEFKLASGNASDPNQWQIIQDGALDSCELLAAQLFELAQKLEEQTVHPGFKAYFGKAKAWAQSKHKEAREEKAKRKKKPQQQPNTQQPPPQQQKPPEHQDK
jgi:hypothetical protein